MALSLPRTWIQSLVRRDPGELASSHSGPKQACEDAMRRPLSANQEVESASAPPGPRALHSSGSPSDSPSRDPGLKARGSQPRVPERGGVGYMYAKRSLYCGVRNALRTSHLSKALPSHFIYSAPLSSCPQPHPWATTQP